MVLRTLNINRYDIKDLEALLPTTSIWTMDLACLLEKLSILAECKVSTSSEELAECKALASNLRCIQVRDTIKEVEDYLKTYLSAGMDISCWQNCSQKYGRYVSKNGRALNPLVDTIPTDNINNTTTNNVAQNVVDENLPRLLDPRGFHVTNVHEFDKDDFSSWNDRFLVYLDGLEPYLLEILENGPFVPLSSLSTSTNPFPKPQKQWSHADKRLANLDTKIAALRPKFNAFKSLEGEKGKSEKGLVAELFDLDEELASSKDEGVTKGKTFMAITEDEPTIGKGDARSSQWVEITIKKANHIMQVQETIFEEGVKVAEFTSLVDANVKKARDDTHAEEIPYDTKFEIKFVKMAKLQYSDEEPLIKFIGTVYSDVEDDSTDSDLRSMPGNDIVSLSGFKAEESDGDDIHSVHKEELSKSEEATAENVLDELADMARNMNSLVDKPSLSDPLGHLQKEISFLTSRVERLESSLAQQVADKLEDFIIKDSINQALPKFDKRVKKNLEDHVPDLILKPLNKELTALNKLETNRMNILQRQLSTVIKVKVRNSVQRGVIDLIKELVILIDTEAPLFKAALAEEKKSTMWKLEGEEG
nr:hypothetical protein [Tanacetum cinerariifolium]